MTQPDGQPGVHDTEHVYSDQSAEPILTIPVPCSDPSCLTCQVADAGARRLCEVLGLDYDTLESVHQQHYQMLCTEVMSAMSQHLLDLDAVRPSSDDE